MLQKASFQRSSVSEPHLTPGVALSLFGRSIQLTFSEHQQASPLLVLGDIRNSKVWSLPSRRGLSLGSLELSPGFAVLPSCWLVLRREWNQHKDVVIRGLGTPRSMFCPSAQTLHGQVNDNIVAQDWGQDPRPGVLPDSAGTIQLKIFQHPRWLGEEVANVPRFVHSVDEKKNLSVDWAD